VYSAGKGLRIVVLLVMLLLWVVLLLLLLLDKHQVVATAIGVLGLRVALIGAVAADGVVDGTTLACVDAVWRPAASVRGQRVVSGVIVTSCNATCDVAACVGIGASWRPAASLGGGVIGVPVIIIQSTCRIT
jgi:hypothetical protein